MLLIPTLIHGLPTRSTRASQTQGAHPSSEDPVVLARRWAAMGFERLHVRELDGPDGRAETADLVRELARQHCLPLQVASVVADETALDTLLDLGVSVVIGGSRGIADPAWLATCAVQAPGQVALAVDLRGGRMIPRGREAPRELFELLDELRGCPLAAVFVSNATPATHLLPADLTRLEEIVSRVEWPVVAQAASVSFVELRNLEERGVSAAVLAASWDHDVVDPRLLAEEFAP